MTLIILQSALKQTDTIKSQRHIICLQKNNKDKKEILLKEVKKML